MNAVQCQKSLMVENIPLPFHGAHLARSKMRANQIGEHVHMFSPRHISAVLNLNSHLKPLLKSNRTVNHQPKQRNLLKFMRILHAICCRCCVFAGQIQCPKQSSHLFHVRNKTIPHSALYAIN